MKVGTLNQAVELQQQTVTRTPAGAVEKSWQTVATLRAEIKPAAKEIDGAKTTYQQSTHVVTARYHPAALQPEARLLYGGRVFDVLTALDIGERKRYVELTCSEVK